MKNILKTLYVLLAGVFLASCSNMNDLHEKYLLDGEDAYVGKIDAVSYKTGHDRVQLSYQYHDPRAKKLLVEWRKASVTVDIPENSVNIPIDYILEGLPEDTYSLKLYLMSADELYKSVPVEIQVTTYGEQYIESLTNRNVKSANYYAEAHTLVITWIGTFPSVVATDLVYTDVNGAKKTLTVQPNQLTSFIDDIGSMEGLSYSTRYKPTGDAFEEFATASAVLTPVEKAVVSNGELDKTKFCRWNPSDLPYPGDYNGAWKIEQLWDNNLALPFGYAAVKTSEFTFDMGQIAKVSKITLHERPDLFFTHAHPKRFSVYGSLSDAVSSIDDWELVGDFESIKPDGLTNDELRNLANVTGETWNVSDDAKMFRYFRFVCHEKWGGSVDIQLMEIEVYGTIYED